MNLHYEKRNIWQEADQERLDEIYDYGERYKAFLDNAKTEREACDEIIEKAKANGYISLEEALKGQIKKGDKIYLNNKDKSAIFLLGSISK